MTEAEAILIYGPPLIIILSGGVAVMLHRLAIRRQITGEEGVQLILGAQDASSNFWRSPDLRRHLTNIVNVTLVVAEHALVALGFVSVLSGGEFLMNYLTKSTVHLDHAFIGIQEVVYIIDVIVISVCGGLGFYRGLRELRR